MTNNTWGGKRPNAGRKKVGDAVLYCRMPQKAVNEIKTAAKEQKLAVGDYLIKQLGLWQKKRDSVSATLFSVYHYPLEVLVDKLMIWGVGVSSW